MLFVRVLQTWLLEELPSTDCIEQTAEMIDNVVADDNVVDVDVYSTLVGES